MPKPPYNAGLFLLPMLLALPALPQDSASNKTPVQTLRPSPATKDWNRLRDLVTAFITEEGTRKVFSEQGRLAESFASDDSFSRFVAPWRARLSALPATQEEASNVEFEVNQKEDGTTSYLMTFHHPGPANALTIVRTLWQDGSLLKVTFMKGFSNIPFNHSMHDRLMTRDDYYRPPTQYTPIGRH